MNSEDDKSTKNGDWEFVKKKESSMEKKASKGLLDS